MMELDYRPTKKDWLILKTVAQHSILDTAQVLELLDSGRPSSQCTSGRPLRSVETHERQLRSLHQRLELLVQQGFLERWDTSKWDPPLKRHQYSPGKRLTALVCRLSFEDFAGSVVDMERSASYDS